MNWNDAIEEAKEELGINGWTDDWDNVIRLAKQKYWDGEDFKQLKEDTLEESNFECLLCHSNNQLTAHHIYYDNDITICLCKKCHALIHSKKFSNYGYILQFNLDYIRRKNIDKFAKPHICLLRCDFGIKVYEELLNAAQNKGEKHDI